MNIALWILQGLLGAMFFLAGVMKTLTPRDKLLPKMPWVEDYSPAQLRLIGLSELLGGLGLVLPWALHVVPVLTPIAAACLTVIMLGAVAAHVRRKESLVPSVILAPLALFVALGRFGVF